MSYRLTPRAQRDVEAIGDFISQDNPRAAVRLIRQFADRWELLATQPYSGASRDDIAKDIRSVALGEYLTFYRIEGRDVLILRVLHGRRDIDGGDFEG